MSTLADELTYNKEATDQLKSIINNYYIEQGESPFPQTTPLKTFVEAIQMGEPIPEYSTQDLIDILFSNNQNGFLCLSTPFALGQQLLFQDFEGTIPVTSDGDPVGLRIDLSGCNNNQWQDVSSRRPVYRNLNGKEYIDTTDAGTWFNFNPVNLDNGCVFVSGEYTGGSGQMAFIGGNTLGYIRLRNDSVFGKNDASSERFINTPTSLGLNNGDAFRINVNSGILRARSNESTVEHFNNLPARSNGLANAQHLYIYGPYSGSYVSMHDYGVMVRDQQVDTAFEQSILNYFAGLKS